MVAFDGRPWDELHGASGSVYSDLPNLQTSWESNRGARARFGIITDYASGERGACAAARSQLQTRCGAFLDDFDWCCQAPWRAPRRATASTSRISSTGRRIRCRSARTPAITPGQFTAWPASKAKPAGLIKFAGEHADSFYSWQGFMEGACLSGIRAANEILADIKSGAL